MRRLRIWWIPNPPREAFTKDINNIADAKLLLKLLADYDLYLGDDLVSSNAGGLEVTETDEWTGEEWYDDEGEDIWETQED